MATLEDLINHLEELRQRWRTRGYQFPGFWAMVADRGHVDAATSVIMRNQIPNGYTALWQNGHLTLSVEALIADGRFDDVLGRNVTDAARHRLREYGHPVAPRVVPQTWR